MRHSIFALMLALLLSSCTPQTLTLGSAAQQLPQLEVQGEATIQAVPDQLKLRLGVVTQSDSADQALAENNRRMTAVMSQLRDLGLADSAISTGQFSIHPEWSQPPRPTPAEWQRSIIGYRVSNELLIETTRIDLAGKLLALAQQAGANQIGGLQFGLADPRDYRQQAIEQATADAIRKARAMAAAAGVELGELLSLSLASPDQQIRPFMLAEARTASADSVPVATGRVEVSATVKLSYRLGKASN